MTADLCEFGQKKTDATGGLSESGGGAAPQKTGASGSHAKRGGEGVPQKTGATGSLAERGGGAAPQKTGAYGSHAERGGEAAPQKTGAVPAEERAAAFLRRHGMYWEDIDAERELERLLAEMEAGPADADRGVKMIPDRLGTCRLPAEDTAVGAIDIGGTNVRAAVLTMSADKGVTEAEMLPPFLTPGTDREMSADEFFRRIAAPVADRFAHVGQIGICFSLASIPQEDRDAVAAAGGKQLLVPDLVGRKVGGSFREALAALGRPCGQDITVINDTVAAALGGYLDPAGSRGSYSGYIGFIYGTGTNICYMDPDTQAMINVESGAYCGFPAGDIDDAYDASLIDTGQDRFEKMVSGGYQGGLMTVLLRTAAAEGDLTDGTVRAILDEGGALTSRDISAFAEAPAGTGRMAAACRSEEDRSFLEAVTAGLTERSALLCAVVITAALLRSGVGREKDRPAFITAEGSTYLKQKDFAEKLSRRMEALAGRGHGLFYEFHTVPDAVLKGTAAACLCHM